MTTKHFILKGRVQGVGMRYFIREEARKKTLSGYVKNMSDGTVFVGVCGPNDQLNQFKQIILEQSPGMVETIEETAASSNDYPQPFEIHL